MKSIPKSAVRYASFYLKSFTEFRFHKVPNTLYDGGKLFNFAKQHRFHLDVVTSSGLITVIIRRQDIHIGRTQMFVIDP